MPSLQDMPAEIINRIYKLQLARLESIKVGNSPPVFFQVVTQQLAGSGSGSGSGRQGGKGKVQDEKGKVQDNTAPAVIDRPGLLSLLLVNRQINAEATSIAYGYNEFEFNDATTLESFLKNIGEKIQHLRHISIAMGGFKRSNAIAIAGRSFNMLAASAKYFRGLSISHFDLCGSAGTTQLQTSTLTLACTSLLQQLAVSYQKQNLKADFTEVVKVVLPKCVGCFVCDKSGKQHVCKRRTGLDSATRTRRACQCNCADAEEKNKAMAEELKWWVSVQPRLT